ncbi:unnamed protein product [Polarella glacialis]|uniref:Saccharopine dehydrogenase NADP binding domain-containing protein n=1 Tax=Polarella glacialis TaxID=89957 RepID=A0A813JNZ3_POLGL|nr:unnamed protein product [Polarella glacialis]
MLRVLPADFSKECRPSPNEGFGLPHSPGLPQWAVCVTGFGLRLSLSAEAPEAEPAGSLPLAAEEPAPNRVDGDSSARPYDIIVLGATGFTGRLIVEHLDALLAQPEAQGPRRRWAVAGRNAARLQALASHCRTAPAVLVTASQAELDQAVAQCHVLLAAAGPFVACGEAVVRACVAAGTHYIDVSGETTWIHDMISRYHEEAKRKGVLVVHCAAQVCAVDEINCYLLARKLGPLKQFREYFFQYGGTTGGTLGTSVATLEGLTPDTFRVFSDPFSLGGRRDCGLRDGDMDCACAEQDSIFSSVWLQPAYSSHTGARVIRRSCQLFEEARLSDGVGPPISYGANLSVVIREGALSKRSADQAVLMAGPPASPEAAKAAARAMSEQISLGNVPRPGEGPPPETRALYYSEVFAVAEAEDGRWGHVHYTGPEAYEVTAMASVAGALVLVEEIDLIQPGERGGVVTPAFAFHGTSWLQRLEACAFANGTGPESAEAPKRRMTFRLQEGKPSEETLREAVLRRSKSAAQAGAALAKGELRAWATPA